jgi:hypothetical protein
MPRHNALSNINIQTEKLLKRAQGHFHISLNKPQIIKTFTDTFIDKHILRINHARPALLTLRRSNKNFMINPDKTLLKTVQNVPSITAKTIRISQTRNPD